MKKIIVSTVASAALTTGAFAAGSAIDFGSDVNGTASEQYLAATSLEINSSVSSNSEDGADGKQLEFIHYVPNIGIGKGNLITVHITNGGAIHSVTANELYLMDTNSTDNNTTAGLVVARMTDFTANSSGHYTHMTFKFDHDVSSQANLVMGNIAETNATLTADNNKYVGSRNAALAVVVPSGLSCSENVNIEVINSTDQSAQSFPVANADESDTGVTVEKEYWIAKADHASYNTLTGVNPENDGTSTECPYYECTVSLTNDETDFGISTAAAANCPSCTSTTTTQSLVCSGEVVISRGTINYGSASLTSVASELETSTSFAAISSITNWAVSTTKNAMSQSGTTASGSTTTSTGLVAPGAGGTEVIAYEITANGTDTIDPRDFDLSVDITTANGTTDLDSIENFIIIDDNTQSYTVAYMNANSDYRTFVRMTNSSSTDAEVMATVFAENGNTSSEFDTGYVVPANGAVIIEASSIATTAQSNGLSADDFDSVGGRYNVTFTVKTSASTNINAVAFQTAGGSQRYLPVGGAVGGAR
jgi:hypothetical protein